MRPFNEARANLSRERRELVLYAWMFFGSIVITIALVVAIHASNKSTRASQQAQSAVRALAQDVQNQVKNRTENVDVWCGAQNATRDYLRERVQKEHHAPFTLGDLNCKQLAAQTARSALGGQHS